MSEQKKAKTTKAIVVNLNAGKDTIKVQVERKIRHKLYDKTLRVHNKFLVHLTDDKKSEIKEVDSINIVQTNPISKRKNWYAII